MYCIFQGPWEEALCHGPGLHQAKYDRGVRGKTGIFHYCNMWYFSQLSLRAMKIDGLVLIQDLKYGCNGQQMTIINSAKCKAFHLSTISEDTIQYQIIWNNIQIKTFSYTAIKDLKIFSACNDSFQKIALGLWIFHLVILPFSDIGFWCHKVKAFSSFKIILTSDSGNGVPEREHPQGDAELNLPRSLCRHVLHLGGQHQV